MRTSHFASAGALSDNGGSDGALSSNVGSVGALSANVGSDGELFAYDGPFLDRLHFRRRRLLYDRTLGTSSETLRPSEIN
jgi:hypothetical protein